MEESSDASSDFGGEQHAALDFGSSKRGILEIRVREREHAEKIEGENELEKKIMGLCMTRFFYPFTIQIVVHAYCYGVTNSYNTLPEIRSAFRD